MLKNNRTPPLLATLEEQVSLLAASKMNQKLDKSVLPMIDLLSQMLQAFLKAVFQADRGQVKGNHNNSAEQHLQNAKRLNQELYALISEKFALALDQDSRKQPTFAKDQEELDMMMEQFSTAFKEGEMSLNAVLDCIQKLPFSSSDILESKL